MSSCNIWLRPKIQEVWSLLLFSACVTSGNIWWHTHQRLRVILLRFPTREWAYQCRCRRSSFCSLSKASPSHCRYFLRRFLERLPCSLERSNFHYCWLPNSRLSASQSNWSDDPSPIWTLYWYAWWFAPHLGFFHLYPYSYSRGHLRLYFKS